MGRTRAVYEPVGPRRTVWMEVETETSKVCLWDVEGAVNLTGLGWNWVGPVMEG